jgi:predicted ATPase
MFDFVFEVEDFAKIKKAHLKVSDMTFFIGDNNSGKSYLMTLLYGIMNRSFFNFLLQNIGKKGAYFIPKVESLIALSNDTKRIFLAVDEIKIVEDIVNEVLDEKKEAFINQLFNENISIGKIKLIFSKNLKIAFASKNSLSNEDINLSIENYQYGYRSAFYNTDDGYGMKTSAGVSSKRENQDYYLWSAFLICHTVNILLGTDDSFMPVYLPASRTGFMLTYKTIIGDSIESKFSRNQKNTNQDILTMPVIEFLKLISSLTKDRIFSSRNAVISFIEENILSGKIITRKMPVSDYCYLPQGISDALPLYVSSGVVTETTPLLLVLKYTQANCLIIEEPEISLHPSLQHNMARTLVKIVNSEMPVIVSTHSDIIFQHINNMIALNSHSNRNVIMSEMKYDTDDLIDAGKVSVYQFRVKKNITEIDKIEWRQDGGYKADTFIDSLSEILNKTIEITSGSSQA